MRAESAEENDEQACLDFTSAADLNQTLLSCPAFWAYFGFYDYFFYAVLAVFNCISC
jgi:hypothetical protein